MYALPTPIRLMPLTLQPIFFDAADTGKQGSPVAYTLLGLPAGTSVAITLRPQTHDRWIMHRSFKGGPYERVGSFATVNEALEYAQDWETAVAEGKIQQ